MDEKEIIKNHYSKMAKIRWSKVSPEERKRIASKNGKLGMKSRWKNHKKKIKK